MADNKIFWIIGIIVVGFLIFNYIPKNTFSTYSFEGISEGQCLTKNTECFNWERNYGKLIDCHIGSENKCYCEFRSYSQNVCPAGTTETKSSTATITTFQDGKQITTTQPKEEIKTSFDWSSIPMSWYLIGGLVLLLIFMSGLLKGKE